MTLTKAPGGLTPRLAEMGYRVTHQGDRLYLWYGEELITFCTADCIPGVLREAAWRDSFLRNLAPARFEKERRANAQTGYLSV